MGKKIAIGSWAFAGPDDPGLRHALGEIGGLGFDGASLAGFRPHAHPDLYPGPEGGARLAAMLSENALEPVEFMPDLRSRNPLLHETDYLDAVERNIRLMEACGFRILRLDTACPPALPEGVSRPAARAAVVAVFREVARRCAGRGITVAWEFEPAFLFNTPREVVEILDAVAMPNFTLVFDTCHAHMSAVVGANHPAPGGTLAGGIREFIAMAAGKIGVVHLADSDNTLLEGGTSTHLPPGSGVIDFDAVVPALLDVGGYRLDWWVIDLFARPDPRRDAAAGRAFVESLDAKFDFREQKP